MKIRLKNAVVYTMNDSFTILHGGAVLVEGGKIVSVGKDDPAFPADRTVDCGGDIVMPAFVNAHSHSAMTLFRSLADDTPLSEWLHTQIFPLEKHLRPEDVYWGTMLAIAESVRSGIAVSGDMYFFGDAVFEAAKKSGMTFVMTGGATDFGGQAEEAAAAEEDKFIRLNGKIPNFKYIMGAHSEYLTTDPLIEKLVTLSAKYRAPLYAHMSETLREVGECTVRNNGLTPPMYFHRMGFFDHGASVAHGVFVDKDDIAVLSSSGVHVVSNPASNCKLASGIAPLTALLKAGINVALGTDGAASNNALDMFREMYLASVLQKCEMHEAEALPAEEALRMATVNGARALFLPDTGVLEAGKSADLIRVSVSAPHFHPRNDLTKHLVYSAARSDVRLTMCRGKIAYEDGSYFIGEELETIYRSAEKSIAYLKKKAGLC